MDTAWVAAAGAGFLTQASQIVALGAQNAYLLRQSLARRYAGMLTAMCTASDVVLIGAGTAGVSTLVARAPEVLGAVRLAGAAFLAWYGIVSLLRIRHEGGEPRASASPQSRTRAFLACLAFTWLNPHVFLDATAIGTLAVAHARLQWVFTVGAGACSATWFTLLCYGGRVLAPALRGRRPRRALDAAVAALMLGLAARLVLA